MKKITKDLILLNSMPGFGYKKLKALLREYGNTSNILKSFPSLSFDIEKEVELINKAGVTPVTVFDATYPKGLKTIDSPPLVLYVKGQIDKLSEKAVAIVGSRRCSHYGIGMAKRISSALAEFDITVVSGMARGIDTAAHKETLSHNGKTVAVLGSGLSYIYPPENKKLSEDIASKGILLSEFPMNTPPLRMNFPRRNRIISALSKGIVVVEAAQRSGALITADFALEQGKDVFAVPANADSYNSKGCNDLIKQGAKLTSSAVDIIEELFPDILDDTSLLRNDKKQAHLPDIAQSEKEVYKYISSEPIDIDTLSEKVNSNSQNIILNLLRLEIAGCVKQLPGKLFVKA